MEFIIDSLGTKEPRKESQTGCILLGVFDADEPRLAAPELDKAAESYLKRIIRRADMKGKLESVLLLHDVPGMVAERVMLVGLGKKKDFCEKSFRRALTSALKNILQTGSESVSIPLDAFDLDDRDDDWKIHQIVLITHEVAYRFDQLKTKPKAETPKLSRIVLHTSSASDEAIHHLAITRATAIAKGVELAKNLANLPGNLCTPTHLADEARRMTQLHHDVTVEILDRSDMKKLGMNTLLAVAKGSDEPPRFIVLRYQGSKSSSKPVVLIGKGITFDSGGISLKPGAEMDEMKFDMCGAASVLGTFMAAAMMKLPLNLIALIPATENMPGGSATKPGDVITSMSGQTVEILNTDAEGRLILCDALTYAERFDPACVVDVATLTGACVISLGHIATGLFSSDETLANELLQAGQDAFDPAWRMPLWEEYQDGLKSNFADLANIGGRPGGAITAACFLSRFAEKFSWAHLDIAGTAWRSGKEKGATGRPVTLLAQFLIDRADKAPATAKKSKRK